MDSNKNWELRIDQQVFKTLSKIPRDYIEKIVDAIEFLAFDPYFGDIEKIKGEKNVWRKRAGRYRIFYELYPSKKFISVFHVEIRSSKTY